MEINENKIRNALLRAKTNFNNEEILNPRQIAQDFRGTFNTFSLEEFFNFRYGLNQAKAELLTGNKKDENDFNIFMNELEQSFYNWPRFFGTESGSQNFLIQNGVFLLLFILLAIHFVYRLEHNIKITPNYLEVFVILCVFCLILFIYHRCANYHSSCKILTISGSTVFAWILCLCIIVHIFFLVKKVRDREKKKENK